MRRRRRGPRPTGRASARGSRGGQLVAAMDLGVVDARQVDRRPAPRGRRARPGGRAAAGPRTRTGRPSGNHSQLVADGDRARGDRPRDDRPVARHGERPVDRHPEEAGIVRGGGASREPRAGAPSGRRSPGRSRPRSGRSGRLPGRCRRPGRGRPPRPGRATRGRPGRTWSGRPRPPDRPSRRRISRCSRVWGITESSAATTSNARSSPVAPASMLRTNRSWPGTSTRRQPDVAQVQGGEAQIDGDPALLLGRQAVGVDARQRPDQGRLAVVDVPGRPEHEVAFLGHGADRRCRGQPGRFPDRHDSSCTDACRVGERLRTASIGVARVRPAGRETARRSDSAPAHRRTPRRSRTGPRRKSDELRALSSIETYLGRRWRDFMRPGPKTRVDVHLRRSGARLDGHACLIDEATDRPGAMCRASACRSAGLNAPRSVSDLRRPGGPLRSGPTPRTSSTGHLPRAASTTWQASRDRGSRPVVSPRDASDRVTRPAATATGGRPDARPGRRSSR